MHRHEEKSEVNTQASVYRLLLSDHDFASGPYGFKRELLLLKVIQRRTANLILERAIRTPVTIFMAKNRA